MAPTFSVRRARPQDAEVLCSLIRELAIYEHLEHKAQPDAVKLAGQLDPAGSPPCGAFVAELSDGTPVGFALFYFKYSTFLTDWGMHLEDLFVVTEYRQRGIGASLMRSVAKEAVNRECRRLELSVLDWNSNAIAFYERLGGLPLDDWTTYRLSGRALDELARQSSSA